MRTAFLGMNAIPRLSRILIISLALKADAQDSLIDLLPWSPSSPIAVDVRGQLSTTFWSTTSPPPALNRQSGNYLDPRASVAFDITAYDHLSFHTTVRVDQGFDPLDSDQYEARVDEYFLRYTPFDSNVLNFQAGRFATVFGGWVAQHDPFDTPFLSAPLPYSQILAVNIRNPDANSAQVIAQRNRNQIPGLFETSKSLWASVIWGPSYGSGLAISGQSQHLDYALEVKNIPLTEQATDWDSSWSRLEHPTWSGRIGYRPDASLALGISASRGPYLSLDAVSLLPAGTDLGDFPYTSIGADFRWAAGHFIVTGELIASEYTGLDDLPLRNLSYYGEVRWKASPSLFLAARWGQSLNDKIRAPDGEQVRWSPNLWRVSMAAGWRVTPDFLIKGEFNHTSIDESGTDDQNLFGLNATWRF